MKKVTITLRRQEILALDAFLDGMVAFDENADAVNRCIASVIASWQLKQIKKKLPTIGIQLEYKLSFDPAEAYAFRAMLESEPISPADALGNRLLQLSDSIQKTFFSPLP